LDEETQQLYVVRDPALGIDVYAETREHLVQELNEQIAFLWDTYAQEKNNRLSPEAVAVANELRAKLKVSG
jgi:hypothetical protein